MSCFRGPSARELIREGVQNRCRWSDSPTPRSMIDSSSATVSHLDQVGSGRRIFAVGNPLRDGGYRFVARNSVDLGAVAEPETHRTGLHVTVTGQQHERHLLV